MANKKQLTLTGRITISFLIVLILITFLSVLTSLAFHISSTQRDIDRNISIMIRSLSQEPLVLDTFKTGEISETAMVYLDSIVSYDNNIDYIVLVGPDDLRMYHPDHSLIGQQFQGGDEGPALNGSDFYMTDGKGTREYQRRGFLSMTDQDGQPAGFLMVSTYTRSVKRIKWEQIQIFACIFVIALLVSLAAVYLLSKRIRRQLLGFEPPQIASMFLKQADVLDSMEEGIIRISPNGTCIYANKMARDILGCKTASAEESANIYEDPDIAQAFAASDILQNIPPDIGSGKTVTAKRVVIDSRHLLMNIIPVRNHGNADGSLILLSDQTETIRMAEQLTGVNQILASLRAITHENSNRMHVILGLLQLGETEEAISYIQEGTLDSEERSLIQNSIQNKMVAALLLGKLGIARERDITFSLTKGSSLAEKSNFLPSRDLVTIIGNLIENAFDSFQDVPNRDHTVSVYLQEGEALIIMVDDNGCGMDEDAISRILGQGYTTKGEGHGIGMRLIRNIVDSTGGNLEIISEPGEGTSITVTIRNQRTI